MSGRSSALWVLGYPEAALADADHALKDAREIGQPVILMHALSHAVFSHILCGNYATANALVDELIAFGGRKRHPVLEGDRNGVSRLAFCPDGRSRGRSPQITSADRRMRSTGATVSLPLYFSFLARAYAELGQFDDARRCIGEAMTAVETTKETWFEAEIHRIAGEIALMSPEPDAAKARSLFERALEIARAQQAKSWELRAAMSMARLWRDQGKRA